MINEQAQCFSIGVRRSLLSVALAAALGASGVAGAGSTRNQHDGTAPTWRGMQNAWASGTGNTAGAWRQRIDHARSSAASRGAGPTVVVTSCADSGAGTLREAATNAVAGTTIDMSALTCSTISLSSGAIDIVADNVTLLGPGQDALTIDGQGNDRVLTSSYDLGIKYLTIANGYAQGPGGCIVATDGVYLGHSTVIGCQVVGNAGGTTPYVGGGVATQGDVFMAYSTVSGNTVSTTGATAGRGGGVYAAGDVIALYDSSVDHNSVTTVDGDAGGGGVFSATYAVVYSGSRVSGNSVISTNDSALGGGIRVDYVAPPPLVAQAPAHTAGTTGAGGGVVVDHAVVSGNSVHSDTSFVYGGGIYISGGGIELRYATISGNTASSNATGSYNVGGGAAAGGGVILAYYSTISDNAVVAASGFAAGGGLSNDYGSNAPIVLLNSTVSGNSVDGSTARGGGVAAYTGAPVYSYNSTVAFNTSSGGGGGLYLYGSPATLYSSIFANNQAPTGADIASYVPVTVAGDHNLATLVGANVTMPTDTLSVDPLLQPLRNNGGPTATHALLACSPAIDNGSNPQAFSWDQRGEPFSRSWGTSQDIGAFELQPNADVIFRNGFDPDPC